MKKFILTLVFLLYAAAQFFAQAPQFINFQAVARDGNGDPKENVTVQVQFIIRNNDPQNGLIVYNSGVQNLQTDACGMFAAKIGELNQLQFSQIDWTSGTKFLEVKADGLTIGNQQMLSVPYALYSEKTNLQEGSGIGVSGNTITNTGDLSNTNEIQTLSIAGNQLSISLGGNTITLPTPPVYTPDIAIFEERYPSGTGANYATSGYNVRRLNTTVLSSPSVSLTNPGTPNTRLIFQQGMYLIEASAPCIDCEVSKLFLRKDIGTNEILLTGTSELSDGPVQSRSFILGILEVPAGGLITRLDHRIGSVPNTSVLGTSNNISGADEVYTQIKIQKIQ